MAASIDSSFSFDFTRECFQAKLKECVNCEDIVHIKSCFQEANGSDGDKKTTLDQSFRDHIKALVAGGTGPDNLKNMIQLAVTAVKEELCSPSIPFLILSDVFDTATIRRCEDVFSFIEENVSEWKSDTFYGAGKNYLLRMCNDLLRRLSKSQNTVFCGRIQLFLARLFPLSEKSGLNLMSQFNIENLTKYELNADESSFKLDDLDKSRDDSMEEGEMEEQTSHGNIPVDYIMYRKFWSLQDFFRQPLQCYEKLAWKKFSANTNDVLNAFLSYKLDDVKSSKSKLMEEKEKAYFAKYLTSCKLLDLQMSDSNFRRYVLIQFMILFRYLTATVKFKGPDHVMSEENLNSMKVMEEKVMKLIKETPPDGERFLNYIMHTLDRDDFWNAWKNDSCPSYVRERPQESEKPRMFRSRKRSIGDDVKASQGKFMKMGYPELTKLWNLCPDNLDAARAKSRIFLPKLETYFEEAIEQAKPENAIEDQYKDYLKPTFQWNSLRLLARKSPHFFLATTQPGKPLQKCLENIMTKMDKEASTEQTTPVRQEDVKEDEEDMHATEGDELQEQNVKEEVPPDTLPKDVLEEIALKVGHDWKRLAVELRTPDDTIEFFESEKDDNKAAYKTLEIWKETEGDQATITSLKEALHSVGLVDVLKGTVAEESYSS